METLLDQLEGFYSFQQMGRDSNVLQETFNPSAKQASSVHANVLMFRAA